MRSIIRYTIVAITLTATLPAFAQEDGGPCLPGQLGCVCGPSGCEIHRGVMMQPVSGPAMSIAAIVGGTRS